MSDLRSLSLALLASTALASPALAQNTQPQTTGQSPAPGTNATDVTAPPARAQQAQANAASSEAGTIRIITNKPELGVTTGRIDGELSTVDHGGVGGNLEGMINLPIGQHAAFRGVAFYQKDAGYIDNIFGSRTYYTPAADFDVPPLTVTIAGLVNKNYNNHEPYSALPATTIDLSDQC